MSSEVKSNRIVEEHRSIWSEFHAPVGISLAESKADWLELLDTDPEMQFQGNWGDLARMCKPYEIREFREWLEADSE